MKDKTVVIIGGSSGFGFEIARQASAEGAKLILTGRDKAKVEAAATRLGNAAKTAAFDKQEEKSLEQFFSTLEPFDHLVSMIGDSMSGGFLTTTPETMQHTLHSKFWTNWLIGRYAAPKLKAGGSLTFTSGTGGRPHEVSATYVANLGIGALVQGLAVELAPTIRVNAVALTFMGTRTQFWKQIPPGDLKHMEAGFANSVPLKRMGTVAEGASAYIYLIQNGFITGQVLSVDGGVMLGK
jgi:NAD(P)-dependent dehydrogenase (short-subunit alcohol dehydrogenase family)